MTEEFAKCYDFTKFQELMNFEKFAMSDECAKCRDFLFPRSLPSVRNLKRNAPGIQEFAVSEFCEVSGVSFVL